MRILVTGATGRVGGNLTKALSEKGHEVKCFVVPGDTAVKKLERFKPEILEGDLSKYDDCAQAVKGVDVIYHMGGYLPQSIDETTVKRGGWATHEIDTVCFKVNVEGTFNLLEATARYCPGCKRFVFASSDGIYPACRPLYVPIDENHPLKGNNMYSSSKILCEALIWHYLRSSHKIPTVALRFAAVIGAGDLLDLKYTRGVGGGPYLFSDFWLDHLQPLKEKSMELRETFEQLKKETSEEKKLVIPYGEDGRPFMEHITDVRDIVQGLLLVLENNAAVGEAFNIAGPTTFNFETAVPYLSKALEIPYIKIVPHSYPVWGNVPHWWEMSIAKARSSLGYNPKYGPFEIIDSAVAFSRGEDIGIVERSTPKIT